MKIFLIIMSTLWIVSFVLFVQSLKIDYKTNISTQIKNGEILTNAQLGTSTVFDCKGLDINDCKMRWIKAIENQTGSFNVSFINY